MNSHVPVDESRRRFLGYLLAAPTLAAAAELGLGTATAPAARAVVPSRPQPPELYDLNDMLTDAARPTANLITVVVNEDGTASFTLPRMEVGQGIVTSTAMLIAEELDLPVSKVRVTLAEARPELLFNQLTGGSNTTISTYTPIRVAAAIAKQQLLAAAAIVLGDEAGRLTTKAGVISGAGGSVTYGELATKAAATETRRVDVTLKAVDDFAVIGKAQNRTDARAAVTGKKDFTLDLQVKGALPTMVCRAPTLNGTPKRIRNKKKVLGMPGITHVVKVSTGVAVRDDLRPVHRRRPCAGRHLGGRARRRPVRQGHRQGAEAPSCPRPCRSTTRWRRRSRPTSPSTSAATARWRPTARSPTSAPTAPRSGPA